MVDEFVTIEKIGMVGILLFIVDKLFKVIMVQRQNKKPNGEASMKNDSRDRILETNNNIKDVQGRQKAMMPAFYAVKNQTNDIHEIITAKGNSGAPKVYNPELHTAILGLTDAVSRLAKKGN